MQSRITNKILRHAKSVVETPQHMIIIGEYGSGKSWLAEKIHKLSNRREQPFHKFNCNALDHKEARKKLFGYLDFNVKGAKVRKGYIENSDGGTLLLEGFDAFPEELQHKIVDVAEKQCITRIGGHEEVPVDVQIVISINVKSHHNAKIKCRNLSNKLDANFHKITYPPLRHRREEILEMVQDFLRNKAPQRYDFAADKIAPKALYLCLRYDWPGNVQELKNAIKHASIISNGEKIEPAHLPATVKQRQPENEELEYLEYTYTYRKAEEQLIHEVMEMSSTKGKTKELLGLSRENLREKMKDYKIKAELT